MTPSRPYMIRAMYEWIVANEKTPYIVINASTPGVQVPQEYVENGKIILNIAPQACRGLHLEDDRIVFSARFSGVAMQIFTPPQAVMAIYAKENGRGMVFNEDEYSGEEGAMPTVAPAADSAAKTTAPKASGGKKPNLKVIK